MKLLGHDVKTLKDAKVVFRSGQKDFIKEASFCIPAPFPIKLNLSEGGYIDVTSNGRERSNHLSDFDIVSIDLPIKKEPKYPLGTVYKPFSQQRAEYKEFMELLKKNTKNPDYEVFKIEKYADLDTLLERWDEFEKVTIDLGFKNDSEIYSECIQEVYIFNKHHLVSGLNNNPLEIGDILCLYPKKLSKLEKIRNNATLLNLACAEIDSVPTKTVRKYTNEILDIIDEE